MDLQTALLLIVAAVLVTIGVTRLARSSRRNRSRNRAEREHNRMGYILIAIGAMVGFIGLLGVLAPR